VKIAGFLWLRSSESVPARAGRVSDRITGNESDAAVIAAANANWDKAAEHAARCAPYLHRRLAPVDESQNRKLSDMTTEELEAAAQEAREEIEKLTENEGADSGGSRPRIRDDVAHHSDLMSPGVPR